MTDLSPFERQLAAAVAAAASAIAATGFVVVAATALTGPVIGPPPTTATGPLSAEEALRVDTTAAGPPGAPAPGAASDRVSSDGVATIPDGSFAFPPRRVSVTNAGVDAPVDATGLLPDRTLEVPADPERIGWYDRFAQPGDPGVSVLLGHVDSREGPGVFGQLAMVRPGDRVEVERHDRRVVEYEVVAIDRHAKDGFPTTEVFTDERSEVLRLITCGGHFDRTERSYRDNVVVTAVPVG